MMDRLVPGILSIAFGLSFAADRTQSFSYPWSEKPLEGWAPSGPVDYATVRRAKNEVGVVATRDGFGPGATWHWRLPDHHRRSPDPIDAHVNDVSAYAASEHLCEEAGGNPPQETQF